MDVLGPLRLSHQGFDLVAQASERGQFRPLKSELDRDADRRAGFELLDGHAGRAELRR